MHSVSSNAVAEESSKITHLFPINANYVQTNDTNWATVAWIGVDFYQKFQSYPEISGKTKKVRLIFNIFTSGQNAISVSLKRSADPDVTVIVNNIVVWGGIGSSAFSRFCSVPIDPTFLNVYSAVYMKSNDASQYVAVANLFAEVYYE